ncbi:MAG: efflux RND transporter periplasmic adaptor subunit [Phycisphaerales bacterium JB040]
MSDVHRVDRDPVSGGRSRIGSRLVLAGVLAAILGIVAWTALPLMTPAREVGVVQAVFVRAESTQAPADPERGRNSTQTVQAPGWLEAEPYTVACTALADGVVESIEVLEGDRVERGDVIARLVAEDSELRLRVAEAELASARASLRASETEREAATRTWDEPVELERAVAAGRAGVAESEAELAQLPSLVEAASATLRRLEEEASRATESRDQGAATELEVIIARQREAAQRAEVRALEARKPLLEARVARLRSDLVAAERSLELRIEDRRRLDASEAAVASAQAAVARAEARRAEAALELDRMTVRAPISGYVQRRLKAPGDKVIRMMDSPHSAHVVHLYDPEQLRVRVDVPLADASHVSVGQACEVVVEVLPDRVFRGEVLRTTHEADLQKNTLEIQVKVHDPDPILRPEMLTRVKFLPSSGRDGPPTRPDDRDGMEALVPEDAIQQHAGEPVVWLVTQRRGGRGSLARSPVSVIRSEDGWSHVRGTVRPGDLIAVGLDRPRAGERVRLASDAGVEGGEPS